jgi:hypothetical protein
MPNKEPRVRSAAEGTTPESETCAGEHFSVAPAYTPRPAADVADSLRIGQLLGALHVRELDFQYFALSGS